MKNPLHYQLSEYDCGPTAMLNAVSFLFEREEISPAILRNIMLYCLDSYNGEG
ncbi:MAG: peptidase C39, partial [Eubacterium sp.]|nr:peptidase C39 [Eubacterium sp.]